MKKTNAQKDLELVQAYLSGDSSAFSKIFDRYSESIKYRMFKKVNDMKVAEDLMMEVFGKVVKSINRFDTKSGAFSTWLYKIASNHFVDHLRKTANHSLLHIDDMGVETEEGDYDFQLVSDHDTPDTILEKEQRAEFAHKLIASIGNDMTREMVQLRFIEELSYEEIATKMNSPLGTVKGALFRARKEMAKTAKAVEMP